MEDSSDLRTAVRHAHSFGSIALAPHWPQKHLQSSQHPERAREAGEGGRTGFLFVWGPLFAIDTDPLQTTGALRTAVAPEPTSALWAARAACTVHA